MHVRCFRMSVAWICLLLASCAESRQVGDALHTTRGGSNYPSHAIRFADLPWPPTATSIQSTTCNVNSADELCIVFDRDLASHIHDNGDYLIDVRLIADDRVLLDQQFPMRQGWARSYGDSQIKFTPPKFMVQLSSCAQLTAILSTKGEWQGPSGKVHILLLGGGVALP